MGQYPKNAPPNGEFPHPNLYKKKFADHLKPHQGYGDAAGPGFWAASGQFLQMCHHIMQKSEVHSVCFFSTFKSAFAQKSAQKSAI